MPEYDPDALRKDLKTLDQNITRIQGAIDKLQRQNNLLRQKITRNDADIKIFYQEIAKLEVQKNQLRTLISRIEKLS